MNLERGCHTLYSIMQLHGILQNNLVQQPHFILKRLIHITSIRIKIVFNYIQYFPNTTFPLCNFETRRLMNPLLECIYGNTDVDLHGYPIIISLKKFMREG